MRFKDPFQKFKIMCHAQEVAVDTEGSEYTALKYIMCLVLPIATIYAKDLQTMHPV